jgi:hypothetical protein
MIWITLKDGTELRYNAAKRGRVEDGFYKMGTKVPVESNMVASIALDEIQRIEFIKPCSIVKLTKRSLK